MAKKVKKVSEVVEASIPVEFSAIEGNVSIKIVKDTLHLKKDEVYNESGDIAALLVAKGIAEII